jgi:signal transduction histidine kinase
LLKWRQEKVVETVNAASDSDALGPDIADLVGMEIPASVQHQRLVTLFEMATILAVEDDLDSLVSRFLACLGARLEAAEKALLLLRDPASGQLEVRAAQGYDVDVPEGVGVTVNHGEWMSVLHSNEPRIYPCEESILAHQANLSEERHPLPETAIGEVSSTRSCFCLPLSTADETLGVLELGNVRQPDSFLQTDLPFLTAVTRLIASAIQGARRRKALQDSETIEEANRLKTELVSTLSHEMRTPLTSIKGYSTALLMEEVSFNGETQREFLQMIDEECDVLENLVHDLLESSTIDAGLLKLEPEPVRLAHVVEGVVSDIARRSRKHHIMVNFPEGFPLVDVDPLRVAQVVRNLLDNAIKYSPDGGLIVVRGQALGKEVMISVADQGVGIAPEHLNRLFEKGFRVKSGLIRHVAGSGLGLPICLTIVESHGGRIWAESKLGQGTTLHFTLPRTDLDWRDEPDGR